MKKKFIQFFQDRALAKKGPWGKPEGKKKVFEKHKQGGHEKGLGQRDEKKTLLSWIHLVLDPFCLGSFLSPLVRSRRSALTRKYKAWTLAMEWHWQRTKFPAKRTKNEKKQSDQK